MRIGGVILRFVVLAVLLLTVTALVLSVFVNGTPEHYQPVLLSPEDQARVADEFWYRIQRFSNDAQQDQPFTWTITQEQINDSLGSLDAISEKAGGGKVAVALQVMDKVGVVAPAVALQNDKLTLMVRSKKLNKVVSLDLSFKFTPEEKLRVCLEGGRVGRLPLPDSVTMETIQKLRDAMARQSAKNGNHAASRSSMPALGGLSADDVGAIMAVVLNAVNGEAIPTQRIWPVNKKPVQVTAMDISDGKLTLHIKPIARKTGASATTREAAPPVVTP